MKITITVDGVAYPVDLAEMTAEQVVRLRTDLHVSPISLVALTQGETIELPEMVGLMWVSLEQRDEPADLRWLLRHTLLSADVDIAWDDPPEVQPAPVAPDLDPGFVAKVAAAVAAAS